MEQEPRQDAVQQLHHGEPTQRNNTQWHGRKPQAGGSHDEIITEEPAAKQQGRPHQQRMPTWQKNSAVFQQPPTFAPTPAFQPNPTGAPMFRLAGPM